MPKKTNIFGKKKRLAVGASGSGTTFEAIARAQESGELDLVIDFLFVDRNCQSTERAEKLGIKVVQRQPNENLSKFHERITGLLREKMIDYVALAGYLRLFPVTNNDPYLVLNSHPAAIPYFGGPGMWGHFVHEAVVAWAKKTNYAYPYTFSTIHIATCDYDRGPILGIRECEIRRGETPEEIAGRLLPMEHKNYVEVLKNLSEGQKKIKEYPREFLEIAKV